MIQVNFIIFIGITNNFRMGQENADSFFVFLNSVISNPAMNVG